jgi:hypothetical protein
MKAPTASKRGRSSRACPLWVRSGHCGTFDQCPLFPRKQTFPPSIRMSALCQKRTYGRAADAR